MDNYGYQNNTQTAPKPPNIFKAFLYAFIPAKYDQLIRVRTGSLIGFVFLLALVATLFQMLVFGIRFIGEFEEVIPDILIRDGKLCVDKDYTLDEGSSFSYVTDKVDSFSREDAKALADAGYDCILLVGRDKLIAMKPPRYAEICFADVVGYGQELKVKDAVRGILYIAVFFTSVIFYVCDILWYFLCSGILLVVGLIAEQMLKRDFQAGQIFRIAVFCKVPVYAASAFLMTCSSWHYAIPGFFKAAITVLFLIAAIRFMPQPNEGPMNGTGNPYGPASY